MANWYYLISPQERVGPVDDGGIAAAIADGRLRPDFPVFREGDSAWRRAREFPELFRAEARGAPPSLSLGLPWTVKLVAQDGGAWRGELRFPDAGPEGTAAGLAPEWRGEGAQPRADIYAMAHACFLAVTGREYDPEVRSLPGATCCRRRGRGTRFWSGRCPNTRPGVPKALITGPASGRWSRPRHQLKPTLPRR